MKEIALIGHVAGIAKFLIREENNVEVEEIDQRAMIVGIEEGIGDRLGEGEGALHMIGGDVGGIEVTTVIGPEGEVQNEEDAGGVVIQIVHLGSRKDAQVLKANLSLNRDLDPRQPKKVRAGP